eukprot:9444875-Heterocapsa_arctica.AAC.1
MPMPPARLAHGWVSTTLKNLQNFWGDCGITPGCAGCRTAAGLTPPTAWPNYHHSKGCIDRRAEWERRGVERADAGVRRALEDLPVERRCEARTDPYQETSDSGVLADERR